MSAHGRLPQPIEAWRNSPFGLRTAVIAGKPPFHDWQPAAANAAPIPIKLLRLNLALISSSPWLAIRPVLRIAKDYTIFSADKRLPAEKIKDPIAKRSDYFSISNP
jgi:hypothetical protein